MSLASGRRMPRSIVLRLSLAKDHTCCGQSDGGLPLGSFLRPFNLNVAPMGFPVSIAIKVVYAYPHYLFPTYTRPAFACRGKLIKTDEKIRHASLSPAPTNAVEPNA